MEKEIKRKENMAQIVEKYCDKIYITDDNPRRENPQNIRRDIIQVLKKIISLKSGIENWQLKQLFKILFKMKL